MGEKKRWNKKQADKRMNILPERNAFERWD